MIRVTSSVQIKNRAAAVKIAAEITNLVKTSHPPKRIDVLIDRFASGGRRIVLARRLRRPRWLGEMASGPGSRQRLRSPFGRGQENRRFVENTQSHSFQFSLGQ